MQKWGDYRYHALDYELKCRFGGKVWKLSLNGGFTCPNRDGSLGTRGCIFCSEGGSGDFAADAACTIPQQLQQQKELQQRKVHRQHKELLSTSEKIPVEGGSPSEATFHPKYIAYFQAFTNTYAPVHILEQLFTQAIADPEVCALSIATRPDCLPPDVIALLSRLNTIKPVWVELGLQTIHEQTALLIRRGYPLPVYDQAVHALRRAGIEVIVHTILGLPGETPEKTLETIDYVNQSNIQGIKLQLLHILRETDLATLYEQQPFHVFTQDEYTDLVIRCLEHLSPEIVIHRLTGDGPKELLIAPLWSRGKRGVLNEINHKIALRGTWQGRCVS